MATVSIRFPDEHVQTAIIPLGLSSHLLLLSYNKIGCCSGFNAFKGWDPGKFQLFYFECQNWWTKIIIIASVVGLGTPNFAEIWKAIEKLP